MGEPFLVVPAAYVILRREGQVLLQLRHNTGYMDGYWASSAAGHVEAGESVVQAAARETFEELAVAVGPEDLVPVCAMHRTTDEGGQSAERVDFFFATGEWSGSPVRAEPHKSAALEWFDLADLPPDVVPFERSVLEQLRVGGGPAIVTHGF